MTQWFDRRSALRVGLLLLVAGAAAPAAAQVPVETAGGVRALGMGGAFTAVADDATATWWNPAGLSTLLADVVLDAGSDTLLASPDAPADGHAAWRARPFALAVALPMLGFTFNHLTMQDIRAIAPAGATPGRQGPAGVGMARAFDLTSAGVTLAQSVGDYLVVGGTVRVLHAGAVSEAVLSGTSVESALDAVQRLETTDRTVADADLGALAFAGPIRLAVVARNLGSHRFGSGTDEEMFQLERNVRLGAAVGPGPAWNRRAWTLAFDADLTTTHAPDGDRRTAAVGGERWLGTSKRVAVRTGARVQTTGDLRATASGGASVAIKSGVFVEGQVTGGGDRASNGWGLAARVTF
jgi:hypothetical protein